MFAISILLKAISTVLDIVLVTFILAVIIEIILRWIKFPLNNNFQQLINRLTEFLYSLVRRKIPVRAKGLDFTAPVTLFLLIFSRSFLVGFLTELANRLK